MLEIYMLNKRKAIVERVRPGIARARAAGKQIGRPKTPGVTEADIRAELAHGKGILKVAKMYGVGTGTVHKIKREMTGA